MGTDAVPEGTGRRLGRGQFLRGAAVGGAALALSLGAPRGAEAQGMTGAGAYLPTGGQFEIVHGDQSAIVTEVGATLRSFSVAGLELLDTFGVDEMSDASRGQVLLPFPNRVDGGLYEFEGEEQQLPLTEAAANNAIHGLTRWLDWTPLRWTASGVTLCQRLYPQDGYPFLLALQIEYSLSDLGLTVATTATNVGDSPLPFGAGHHPYLTVGTRTIDAATLRLPARTTLETNDRLIPTGRSSVAGTDFDFRDGREIGATQLDTCFTDVIPEADGFTRVYLTHPDGSPQITLGMDPSHGFIQVYTGDTLPEEDQRRGIAIEPMTCAPNAFNSGDGLRVLAPGESFTSVWGMVCR
ncbi:aldose epimerase [Rubrobacter tropicus]|uniref:Aldose epimerase n=1 Tax=Rubrobacter tropicus TaxID=2653851 RepID=A0A6G8Q4U0_9ACTN|nr:aldose 1-epimerase family protein [Rubrobacter tropicus]QIN81491.1 aldose epimerase [Rubrobacter tropicus]